MASLFSNGVLGVRESKRMSCIAGGWARIAHLDGLSVREYFKNYSTFFLIVPGPIKGVSKIFKCSELEKSENFEIKIMDFFGSKNTDVENW